jgi:4-amino-4-deoxy-L-arabinose transferase-like glycosyltransferase
MRDRADRLDYLIAVGVSLLTVLSRLPYRARMLYNWDAVQFALALREYDVVKHQPHPPGYILYVALGRLVHGWVGDAAAAYVLLAVAFSGGGTFVVYLLARAVYDRSTAVTAATLLAVSPLFWFYGTVGLSYVGEALMASVVAYFSFRALRGSETDAWLAAGYLGLAGGFRQSLLVLMFPLWLTSVAAGARRPRVIVVAGAVLGLAVIVWFLPMIWLTGGLERYLEASRYLADTVVKPTSILGGPLNVTLRMSRYLLESLLVALGPLAAVVLLVPWYVRRHGWGRREWFLLAWTVPPMLVYTLVHFGQAGYVLTILPALVILLSRILHAALERVAQRVPSMPARAVLAGTAVTTIVVANGAFFVSARPMSRDFETPKAAWRQAAEDEAFDWIFSRTAAALREHEQVMATFVTAIRGLYSPSDTVIITELGNTRSYPWLRHAMFYLPGFTIFELRVGDVTPGYYAPQHASAMTPRADSLVELPVGARRLVWFVDHWSPASDRPPGLMEIELPYGRFLYVLGVGRKPVHYAGYTLVRAE